MDNFFSPTQKEFSASDQLQERLAKSVENLFYLSETDAAFEVIAIEGQNLQIGADLFRKRFAIDPAATVEEQIFDELFARLTRTYEGANASAAERARRFADLRDLLAAELTEIKVLRFGNIRIDIFIVGRDNSGRIVGLKTFAVET